VRTGDGTMRGRTGPPSPAPLACPPGSPSPRLPKPPRNPVIGSREASVINGLRLGDRSVSLRWAEAGGPEAGQFSLQGRPGGDG
jgi:hypothetical protein